ncbi:MAG: Rap1a/Tai family immunity protein [Gammaproteobacteria bacterium]|nr:Rap1a/Tai family immunity protein [Gammaproteobacteria bacterium]
MNKILAVLLIVIIVSAANAAVYHFFNGEKLAEAALEWEKSQTHPKDSDLLLVTEFAGYVGAMFDHLSEKQHICAPDEITKNEIFGVVTDYLKNTRKGLKYSGSVVVEKALYKKFPCK